MTTIHTTDAAAEADRLLKTKHRAIWESGNYGAVASELISALGETLVAACAVTATDRVLDIAAGTGNAAIPAALRGAAVVATDLAPALLDEGRVLAAARGVSLDWRTADAEALPFGDGEFDTVLSCVGVMFAPHHQQTADEVLRVTRPGGTIGLVNWTPAGFIGQLFATMKPFAPPPPPGAQPPPLWGDLDHVRALFGDRVDHLAFEKCTVRIDHFARPEDFRDYFKRNYGPTIAVYGFIADQDEDVAELDAAIDALAAQALTDGVMEWEYLLTVGTRNAVGSAG